MKQWLSVDMVQLRRKRGSPQRAQQHLTCLPFGGRVEFPPRKLTSPAVNAATGTPSRYRTRLPVSAAILGPGVKMPARFSGSEPDTATRMPLSPRRRVSRKAGGRPAKSPATTPTTRPPSRVPDTISFTLQVRQVLCSARLWSSWPRPFALSCWQARWRLPWPASAPTMP